MDFSIKAYDLFLKLCRENLEFRHLISENLKNGKIRFFNEEEWDKINSQNFVSPSPEMEEFLDLFTLGYNIGNCVGTSKQLSFSYDNVDIVSGILPILKGTLNAEKEGGHCWLETDKTIIDTTLMLVIDKSLKHDLGYLEEQKLTSKQLSNMPLYQARKEFVNDKKLKKSSSKK